MKLQQQIKQLEDIAKQHLTKEAITRYGNIKTAHPELAVNIIAIIVQAVQSGQLKEKINDNQLKDLLKQIQGPKKEFKISRR